MQLDFSWIGLPFAILLFVFLGLVSFVFSKFIDKKRLGCVEFLLNLRNSAKLICI